MAALPDRKCVFCGDVYKPLMPHQKRCQKPECERARNAAKMAACRSRFTEEKKRNVLLKEAAYRRRRTEEDRRRNRLMKRAVYAAKTRLINAHLDEFHVLENEERVSLGLPLRARTRK